MIVGIGTTLDARAVRTNQELFGKPYLDPFLDLEKTEPRV